MKTEEIEAKNGSEKENLEETPINDLICRVHLTNLKIKDESGLGKIEENSAENSKEIQKETKSSIESDMKSRDFPTFKKEGLQLKQYSNMKLKSELKNPLEVSRNRILSDGTLKLDFNTLLEDVKRMRLPGPEWKIKAIMRDKLLVSLTFSKGNETERRVTLSSQNKTYSIYINEKRLILLGSPQLICGTDDLSILLDILNNIVEGSPMILYV